MCNHRQKSVLEHFYHLQKKPHWLLTPNPPTPTTSPKQPLIYFLSLHFPILYFHMNRILQYVVLCVRLLPLSMIFSQVIYVVACIRTSFLFYGQIIFHCVDIPHFFFLIYFFKFVFSIFIGWRLITL